MKKVIIAVIIMLASAYLGIMLGSILNGPETFGIIFTIISGFACTIYVIENKKKD